MGYQALIDLGHVPLHHPTLCKLNSANPTIGYARWENNHYVIWWCFYRKIIQECRVHKERNSGFANNCLSRRKTRIGLDG